MSLPGATVSERQSPPSRSTPIVAGTWFVSGLTERGPSNEAVLIFNMQHYVRVFGEREGGTVLYDAADTFFREGGSRLYVSRVVGPTPTKATANLSDGTNSTATVTAKHPGAWGADIDVVITAPNTGTIKMQVLYKNAVVETSPEVADVAALAAWAATTSDYITVTDLEEGDPQAATTALTGGTDDRANATDATWAAALDLHVPDLGPGQVSYPGRTTANAHAALLAHAGDRNRLALLDLVDTKTVGTLTAASATNRALATGKNGGQFAPWAVVPGIVPGTTRTVPYSAVEAGIMARNDSAGNSPNVPAAGEVNGRSRYAVGLSQTAWTDTEREALNDAGVNVARMMNGQVTTYGYRTPVDGIADDTWLLLSNRRLYMVIAARADQIAGRYVFAEIDGKGLVFSRLNGELKGMLMEYYPGSLYGETFEEAALVDTGPQVNTPETIAALEINALLSIRMSPYGETVDIGISKTRTLEAL